MRKFLFEKIKDFAIRKPYIIIGVIVFLCMVFAIIIILKPPSIDSDIMNLLPENEPAVKEFKEAVYNFRSIDYLFILLESKNPEDTTADNYEDFADRFAEELKRDPDVERVEYRLQDFAPLLENLLKYTLLYLPPERIPQALNHFSDKSIDEQMARNTILISSPASLFAKDLLRYDPLGLFPILKEAFIGKTKKLSIDVSDGYYRSKDGRALLIIVEPKSPAQNIPFSHSFMKKVKSIEASCRKEEFADDNHSNNTLEIQYGGGYPIADDDASLVKRDALINTFTSLTLVLFVFIYSFRKKSALLYGWVPLLISLFLTFGFIHALGFKLNSATAGFGALLIGLGIDFSTVMYGRYVEERNKGVDAETSISNMMGGTTYGVLSGAITTAASFGAMLITDFRGMRELGFITATGIMITAIVVILLMPAMLHLHFQHKKKKGEHVIFHMHTFGIEHITNFARKYPILVLVISAIGTIIFSILATGIKLEDRVSEIRSPKNTGILASKEIGNLFGASMTYMMATFHGKTGDEITEKSSRILSAIEPFVKKGEVTYCDSINKILPPPNKQEEARKLLAETSTALSPIHVRNTFTRACMTHGFNPAYFSDYVESLSEMLNPKKVLTYDDLSHTPIKNLLNKYIVKKGERDYTGVVYIYIPDDYKRYEPAGMEALIKKVDKNATLVGVNKMSRVLRHRIKVDALVSFVLGTIAVIIIMIFDFKSIKKTLYAILPLFMSLIWMVGIMAVIHEKFNIVNIFVTTMIIGIGVDYGIHVVHRFFEKNGRSVNSTIAEAGRPMIIAALTTIAGFGSMITCSYPAMKSMGVVALIGTALSMLFSLTTLIAILTLEEKKSNFD